MAATAQQRIGIGGPILNGVIALEHSARTRPRSTSRADHAEVDVDGPRRPRRLDRANRSIETSAVGRVFADRAGSCRSLTGPRGGIAKSSPRSPMTNTSRRHRPMRHLRVLDRRNSGGGRLSRVQRGGVGRDPVPTPATSAPGPCAAQPVLDLIPEPIGGAADGQERVDLQDVQDDPTGRPQPCDDRATDVATAARTVDVLQGDSEPIQTRTESSSRRSQPTLDVVLQWRFDRHATTADFPAHRSKALQWLGFVLPGAATPRSRRGKFDPA